jgi:hypothetical protein
MDDDELVVPPTDVALLSGASAESDTNVATDYRVVYRDGRNQEVIADGYTIQGDFVIFTLRENSVPVLAVAADLVEHIGESGAPEPE